MFTKDREKARFWRTIAADFFLVFLISLIVMSAVASAASSVTASGTIGKWEVYEVTLTTTNSYSNPYKGVSLSATFNGPNSKEIVIDGFWDGGDTWKIRIAPTEVGTWTYTTTSNDDQLNGKTGTFEAVSSYKKGFVRVNPDYPYSFMYDDGTPYLPVGDNVWTMFSSGYPFDEAGPTGANFKSYVDKRAMQGFNWMHGQLGYWTGSNEGGPPFSASGDVNPAYYQWVDKRVSYATEKGLVIGLTFDLNAFTEHGGMSSLERYSCYLVARYGAYNVAWLISPEYNDEGDVIGIAGWRQIGQKVAAADPYRHPCSIHPCGTSGDDFGTDAWMTWVAQQHRGTPASQNSYTVADYKYNKPIVNIEPGYEWHDNVDNEQTAEELRKDFWAIVMGGGFAIYGHKETFVAPHVPFNPDVMDSAAATYVMCLAGFLKSVSWWELAPHNSLVSSGFCLADPGNEYVVYLPDGGSVTVDLSDATGTLNVEWYNPRNGTYYDEGTVTGGGNESFTPPFSGDAVLHIISNFLDTCGGTYPSISGTHTGTITPSDNITVQKMYTYPYSGTGGHSKYVRIWNASGTIAEGNWTGYEEDWHTISFDKLIILRANESYNYSIRTGSYPQIIHKPRANVTGGTITCEKFVDVNGESYNNWIPAIKLYSAEAASASSNISDDLVHAGGDTELPATVLCNSYNTAVKGLFNALKSINGFYTRLFYASKLI